MYRDVHLVYIIWLVAGRIHRKRKGDRARKGRKEIRRKDNRMKEEGSKGCRWVAVSYSLARTLSSCVRWGHLDYHLRPKLERTELGRKVSKCLYGAPDWSPPKRKLHGKVVCGFYHRRSDRGSLER